MNVRWGLVLAAVVVLLAHDCVGLRLPLSASSRLAVRLQAEPTEGGGGKGFGKPKAKAVALEATVASVPSSAEVVEPGTAPADAFESTDYFKTDKAKREKELDDKIARLREEEALLATDPSVGAVPELVADRMLGRIVTFFGIPVFGGLAIFVGAFFYSKKYDIVVPPAVIAYATQVPFVLGLLGITYGILSSSWDKEPGSALGFKEFKTNVQRVRDGLGRTKDTATLKDEIEKESQRLGRRRREP